MYSLRRDGPAPGNVRLLAPSRLTPVDFEALTRELGVVPIKAKKIGLVSARRAEHRQSVETRWNGAETVSVAEPGDSIVANMDAGGAILRDRDGHPNLYVIRAARFPELYEPAEGETEFGQVYRPRGVVEAIHLPGGFEIMAPWGEIQRAGAGYLIRNGEEIYGNQKETFERTYAITPDPKSD